MNELIDISVPLHPGLPLWPETPALRITQDMSLAAGDVANVSRLDLDAHSGTHIDAPLHFIPGGDTTDDIPLHKFIGPCFVADFTGLQRITATDLEAAHIPDDTRRLLLKTDNSALWQDFRRPFRPDFCALSLDAAQWIAERGMFLVGIDYHSIQMYDDSFDTHIALLQHKVVILESLHLRHIAPGPYELLCLPLRVWGVEAVPVRAVLRR